MSGLQGFLAARQAGWKRLELLLAQCEAAPARELDTARLHELLRLYRQACSDLGEARALTASPEVLGPLNDLTGRAYHFVYRGGVQGAAGAALRRFLDTEVPAAFRRRRHGVLAAAAALLLGVVVGLLAVVVDRANAERLVPGEFFTESPRERVEKIEQGEERIDTVEKAMHFGASLYTHNIQVAFLTFAMGALTLVGGLALLFYNGVILGAVAATYLQDGVSTFFLAWVGPHGALEIPAIVFGGAAGLVAGRALHLPGDLTRASAVRASFPDVWRMMMATVLVLVAAGLVEGSFSQFSSKTFPAGFKIAVAALLFAALFAYLFLPRAREARS